MFQKIRVYLYPALLLLAGIAAGIFLNSRYVCVGFHFYPRSSQILDLSGETLTARQFDKLSRKLPDCDITWDVPLSEGTWSSRSETITVNTLTEADVAAMGYFPNLRQVDAGNCTDYGPLLELVKTYPELDVAYTVTLGEDSFSPDAREIVVRDVPEAELPRLGCLTQLSNVVCAGGADAAALMRYCHDAAIAFSIQAGDQVVKESSKTVRASNVTAGQLPLFALLPQLKTLELTNPQASADQLLGLRQKLENVQVSWSKEVCGVSCFSGDEVLDISQGKVDLEEIRREIACFPEAKSVYLGKCGIDNETLAAFREEMRDTIKVVWQVDLGKKLTARTDDTSFMPVRENVYYFNDEEAYNLRYCEDMVAVDIGHMSIHNIDFVEFMPNLTYLILAHTQLQYIDPISTCKNLKFLELDWSPVRDLSPLTGCTGLEDLNLGKVYCSFDPITKMTWLKNLWVIECNAGVTYKMTQALPNTRVQGAGNATVASGWRNLPNYYDMRDALGMYYMSWS